MSVKECAMKFTQLSRYAPDLVSNMRSKMRKFSWGLSRALVLECKGVMLNSDMDISRLVVYMQQVEDEKKKQAEVKERQSKKTKYVDQDASQQNSRKGSRQ